MDHLHFCHDYSAVHFPAHSPRVLLLHSILGVGTNIFPMEAEHIPKLEALLTPFELKHISAFPSFVRLLSAGLVEAMARLSDEELAQIKAVHFHRVIDNTEHSLSGEDLWIHLNFHVMHFLDFLPAAGWKAQLSEPLFQMFVELYNYLKRLGNIQCNLDFNLASPCEYADASQLPLTLGTLVSTHVPKKLARKLAAKAVRQYSRDCRHSLKCEVEFKDSRRSVLMSD